jgi:uncharacterized membrane protein YheB (UPF0754 family)
MKKTFDDDIPVLTEVIRTNEAISASIASPSATNVSDDANAKWQHWQHEIYENVLQNLLGDLTPNLSAQIHQHVSQAVEQLSEQITQQIKTSLENALRETVDRALAEEMRKFKQ